MMHALRFCVSPSTHFFIPFQCGLRRNTLVSAAFWKAINMAVGIKNCVPFFENSMLLLLILSVSVFSVGNIPRYGVSNSL